ncbi:30S ribosomal protein S6 [Candidatus Sumerlaeota bacterium]|nr:30S ribosomal protein S6 [Candidatus Sumerlaeales bacterium]NLD61425.1 30S ribosomal protein S6 [Candidatus Sumerlaeota bacterium]
MAKYELVVIWDPYMSDDDYKFQVEKGKDQIARRNGEDIVADVWGKRVMAYEINKKPEGYYVVYSFSGDLENAQLQEIERSFRLNETVLREMLVVLPKEKVGKPVKTRRPAPQRRAKESAPAAEQVEKNFTVRSAGDAGNDSL